ncbi:arginine N-methyltransferase [Salpingoeca rosetta]|uniref:Arginine N-methyltransferase n=1 Tax=Salpingoeca rosetta (strain ATCC 50818 / BSB-021) TaxID=946362 RepID=F2UNA7_SALR5|nr:arginine N-methyltransferase [Salpingoeca rosetta]EGD79112.1 arginine N-methyltransferase [Salpingoeca rosetta]|eukprot:XP_004989197.1 arginine N-methyltransferase [Salpingoeca rosetta]
MSTRKEPTDLLEEELQELRHEQAALPSHNLKDEDFDDEDNADDDDDDHDYNEDGGHDDDYDDDGDDYDDDGDARNAGKAGRHNGWVPPGADNQGGDEDVFGTDLDEHFYIPRRLEDKCASLVEAVNDFHFAMLNDSQRNDFYRQALARQVKPGDVVLEIGTGSGLLAMLAASAGAKHVYTIEANRHLAALARKIIRANNLQDKITVINKLSTNVHVGHDFPERCDVLVSEILGTLLLGESALQFVADARRRLLKKDAAIIPRAGRQFISLVQSNELRQITSVQKWEGFDLHEFNALQDTVSLVFTKQYGFRFSSVKHDLLVAKQQVCDVDFTRDGPGSLGEEVIIPIVAEADGTVDAVLTYWEAYGDKDEQLVMSTEPEATKDNFARDMQWGQALQLVEDLDNEGDEPKPFVVSKGERIDLIVRFSEDSAVMQFALSRPQHAA